MKDKMNKRIEKLEKQIKKLRKEFNQYVENHKTEGYWRK
jgi:prefoldin subunit 5